MSFILDALRKAESERNRNVGPVLMDARIASPRRALPGWAVGLGVVLLLNLGLLAWLLGRTQSPAASTPAAAATTSLGAAASEGAMPAIQAAPAVQDVLPPAPRAPQPAPATATAQAPSGISTLPVAPPHASGPSLAATGDEERLPDLRELRNAGVSLPELSLNLHVYARAPADRSVLLNGQRAREGDYLPNGVKVERITPQAVILEASGRRFRLTAGE